MEAIEARSTVPNGLVKRPIAGLRVEDAFLMILESCLLAGSRVPRFHKSRRPVLTRERAAERGEREGTSEEEGAAAGRREREGVGGGGWGFAEGTTLLTVSRYLFLVNPMHLLRGLVLCFLSKYSYSPGGPAPLARSPLLSRPLRPILLRLLLLSPPF